MNQFEPILLNYIKGEKLSVPVATTVRVLPYTPDSVAQMMELQDVILSDLGPGQTFVTVNTPQTCHALLDGKRGITLGVFLKGTTSPIALQSLSFDYKPEMPVEDFGLTVEQTASFCGFKVHPDYRKNHLTLHLVDRMKVVMADHGKHHATGYVDAANDRSWKTFLHAGFGISHCYDCPDYGLSYAFMISSQASVQKQLYYPQKLEELYNFVATQQAVEKVKEKKHAHQLVYI